MKNFIDDLYSINSQTAESIRINFFIRKMRRRLYDINQTYSENIFVYENEIKKLNDCLEKSNKNFSDKIKKWETKFTSNKEEEKKLTILLKNMNTQKDKKKWKLMKKYLKKVNLIFQLLNFLSLLRKKK